MSNSIDKALLQNIWNTHHLGSIHSLARPGRGMVNECIIVNDAYVIRFDTIGNDDQRYAGEARAYDALRLHKIPAPQVIALDFSKRLAPHDYFIMSKIPGETVVDSWDRLTHTERQHVAYITGQYLATMHTIQMPRFGKLYDLAGQGFDSWFDFVADFFTRYANEAIDSAALPIETTDRVLRLLHKLKPAFERITQPVLVHSDYHFENLLQQNGEITGIIDFEWSIAGDPSWDFKVEDQWEETCPGSKIWVYEGYTSLRPLDEHHPQRVAFYNLLMNLDDVVWTKTDPNQHDRHDEAQAAFAHSIQKVERLL